jgi:hypothetical protein
MIGSQQAQLRSRDPAELATEVGVSIGGYRVERVLSARPGLHTVVEASDRNGQRLRLKVLAKPLSADKELRRRLQRLARLRASIEHPHLLPLQPLGESGRRLFLASPAVGARTLADRLCDGPLAVQETMRLLGEVAGALEAAGRHGLVHRELAPENILLTEDEPSRALLTDFGIAIPPARRGELFGAAEAIDYRSPEELRGEPVDTQSNAYSLACILVECLTGGPPYPYDRPLLTLHAHLVDPPPRVSGRRAGLPPELDTVVATGLAKDPSERYRSPARLMRAAREAAGVDAPIPVVPPKRATLSTEAASPPGAARPPRPAASKPAPRPRKAGRPHQRGARPWRARAALALASLALLASAAGGFALGMSGPGGTSSSELAPAASRQARDQRARLADYVSRVDQAVERLGARRAAARRRLRRAERPTDQAAQAEALAAAYSKAAKELAGRPPAEASAAPALSKRLRATARAYRRLAAAARQGSERAWRDARDEALQRERDFQRALGTLQSA